jgi:hypothetical protein
VAFFCSLSEMTSSATPSAPVAATTTKRALLGLELTVWALFVLVLLSVIVVVLICRYQGREIGSTSVTQQGSPKATAAEATATATAMPAAADIAYPEDLLLVGAPAPAPAAAPAPTPRLALEDDGKRIWDGDVSILRHDEKSEVGLAPLHLGASKVRLRLPFSRAHEEIRKRRKGAATRANVGGVQLNANPCDAVLKLVPTPLISPSAGVRRYFFGVGLNYISQPENRLTSCWTDIDLLYDALAKRYGTFTKTWLLTDKRSVPQSELPTYSVVKNAWSAMITDMKTMPPTETAHVFFMYSGHGSFRLTTDPTELDGQSECIVLLDQFLYDYDIMGKFLKPLGANVKVFIVFDSCNSGSAANLPWTFNPLSNTVNQSSMDLDVAADIVMISGCRDEQTSAAGATSRDASACTRVLIEALKEFAPHTAPVTDLTMKLRRKLTESEDTQIPQLSMSKPSLLGALL